MVFFQGTYFLPYLTTHCLRMDLEHKDKVESLTKAHASESQAYNQAADNLKFQVSYRFLVLFLSIPTPLAR